MRVNQFDNLKQTWKSSTFTWFIINTNLPKEETEKKFRLSDEPGNERKNRLTEKIKNHAINGY